MAETQENTTPSQTLSSTPSSEPKATKAFPKVGIGVTYYGGASPAHVRAHCKWLEAGIPVVEMHGCAYPEMSRAELCRQARSHRQDGLEVLVICDQFQSPDPSTIQTMAREALNRDCIVISDLGDRDYYWEAQVPSSGPPACSLSAIPVHLLDVMVQKMESEGGAFFKTPFTTQLTGGDREKAEDFAFFPLFSPFDSNFQSVQQGLRVEPDCAFLLRAERYGIRVSELCHGPHPPKASVPRTLVHVYERRTDCKLPNYTLCLASYGALDLEQQKALWELRKAGLSLIHIENCPYIDVARELLVQYSGVLHGKCDGVMMLDHDIAFIPQDAADLMTEAHVRNVMMGVPYCMRKTGHNIIGAFELPAETEIPFFDGGGIFPAAYTGMGFTAIPRDIIEDTVLRMKRPPLRTAFTPAYPLFALKVENGFYAGEDVSFCSRVHDLRSREVAPEQWEMQSSDDGPSGKIFLDTRKRIFHKGIYHYGIEDAGIAVPRVKSLRTQLAVSGQAARDMVMNATDLKPETQAGALGLDPEQNPKHRHPLLGDSL